MKKIGLLGCGVMGTQIALAIDSGKIPGILTHVYDDSKEASSALVSKLKNKPEIVENSHLLSSHSVNIVVEAASQNAVRDDGLSILQNKRDFMIMSVGALLDESIYDILYDACDHFKKTIYLPSGAIAGLDGLKSIKDEGKHIAGYGAPTKSTTLLSHFNIGKNILDFIVDDNPLKQGKFSPGFHIPIMNSDELYDKMPDYLVILAWNFSESIMKKHKKFKDMGGKFILPMPEAHIVP